MEEYTWTAYPEMRTELPADGKVTGTFSVSFQGDGYAYAGTTGAHVNDDNPAIDFRGESFLTSLRLRRQSDGTFAHVDSCRPHVTRRSNWTDAPPSFADAIVKAVCAHVADLWTEELEARGTDASARQNLSSLQREEAELRAKLAEVRKSIRAQVKRTL